MSLLSMPERSLVPNPLTVVEHVLQARDLPCERVNEEELIGEALHSLSNYRLWFTWNEEFQSLVFTCVFESKVPAGMRPRLHALLASVNERLWIGHFDLSSQDDSLAFRHTLPLRGTPGMAHEQVEDLLDVAFGECERFYPAFQAVIWGGRTPEEALEFSLFETIGQA